MLFKLYFIAMLAGNPVMADSELFEGFETRLECDLAADHFTVSSTSLYKSIELFGKDSQLTAIFCANDEEAESMMKVIEDERQGRSI